MGCGGRWAPARESRLGSLHCPASGPGTREVRLQRLGKEPRNRGWGFHIKVRNEGLSIFMIRDFYYIYLLLYSIPYNIWCVYMLSHLCHVQLSVTLWPVAHQAPLSVGFSRQEFWSCCALLQRLFLTQGSNPCLLHLLY